MITQLLYLIKYGLPALIDLLLNFVQEIVFLFKWLFVALDVATDLGVHLFPASIWSIITGILAFVILYKIFGREG